MARKWGLAAAVGLGTLMVTVLRNRPAIRRTIDAARQRRAQLPGRLRGLEYRLSGRHPDENVPDLVLADRIRSTLGPLEHRLDLPHIHVMVNDHVAMLHGEVSNRNEAQQLETAVMAVSGVRGVKSFLHVGLAPSDTRPSEGRDHARPSDARVRLVSRARSLGATSGSTAAVRAVLSTFADRLPANERAQLMAHLPHDVRELAEPPRRHHEEPSQLRTEDELLACVLASDPGLDEASGRSVILGVLGALADLVPEEATDISAVLPGELRELWGRARAEGASAAPPID